MYIWHRFVCDCASEMSRSTCVGTSSGSCCRWLVLKSVPARGESARQSRQLARGLGAGASPKRESRAVFDSRAPPSSLVFTRRTTLSACALPPSGCIASTPFRSGSSRDAASRSVRA